MSIFLDLYIFNPFHIYFLDVYFTIIYAEIYWVTSRWIYLDSCGRQTWTFAIECCDYVLCKKKGPKLSTTNLSHCTSCQSQSCLHSSCWRAYDSHLLNLISLICLVSSNSSNSSSNNINLGRRTLTAVRRFVIVLVPHKPKPYGHLVLCSQYLCPATLDCVPRPRDCPCPNVEDIKCLILDTAAGTGDATVVCTRGQNGCVEVENLLKKRVQSKKKWLRILTFFVSPVFSKIE